MGTSCRTIRLEKFKNESIFTASQRIFDFEKVLYVPRTIKNEKKNQTKSNQNASLCIGRAEQPRRNNNAQNSGGGGAQRQRPDADLSAVPRAISPGIVLFFML